MPDNPGHATDSLTRALEVLTRETFDETALFELLDVVASDRSEYARLAENAGRIDEFLGGFPLPDRKYRKAAADLALGFPKHALFLLQDEEGRLVELIRARAWQLMDKHTRAVEHYRAAAKFVSEPTAAERIFCACSLCLTGRADEAREIRDSLSGGELDMPGVPLLDGLLAEAEGDIEKALEIYAAILEKNPDDRDAVFRTALILDQRGEDEDEVERLYRKLADGDIFHEGAAVNLGLLYLDLGRFDEAEAVFNRVLRYDTDNPRVWLYLKDARLSKNMRYDEGRHKEDEKLRQILRLPISEFELSVRSRNCLARMNVHTLGDLISKTETELLAYKNFGETSLKEIKEILARKGLHLGMAREEVERKMRSPSQRLAALTVSDNILEQPISALNLSVRSLKCLEALGIDTVEELTKHSERSLMASKNFGLTSLQEVKKKLATYGLSLATDDM
ncbi:MAG: hypothetical protein DRP90_01050 [Planctomycetota bacterium]|nr:MAG: hypothetical protein DRP90_01050 [Planctomycetota bacterium]